jgi:uncharacterized integral membrane protein
MTRSPRPLGVVVLGSLVAGLGLMIAFEATITRVIGVALLFTFIVGGLFMIAEPAFLEGDEK